MKKNESCSNAALITEMVAYTAWILNDGMILVMRETERRQSEISSQDLQQ
jgi:hypothetical protein